MQWRAPREYLVPRLGGSPEEWARANVRSSSARGRGTRAARPRRGSPGGEGGSARTVGLDDEMCEALGMEALRSEAFAIATAAWVSERVRADIPGAIDTVRWLDDAGLTSTRERRLSWRSSRTCAVGHPDRFDNCTSDLVDRWRTVRTSTPRSWPTAVPSPSARSVETATRCARRGLAGLRTFPSLVALREALASTNGGHPSFERGVRALGCLALPERGPVLRRDLLSMGFPGGGGRGRAAV